MFRLRFVFSTILAALVPVLMAGSVAVAAENYKIDTSHSMVVFKVRHLGVSNNYGRFNDITGTYTFDAENPGRSAFEVKVKTESVDTHDAKRDQHLKSPDFFNAKQFPVITLKSKSVKKKGDAFEVTGELSMLGKKQEIAFILEHVGAGSDPWGNYRRGFETSFKIKRSQFGMNYMPDGVGDEVTLMINIEGVRQ